MADHAALEKLSSTAPMLPDKESDDAPSTPRKPPGHQPVGKLLIREDTYLGRLGQGGGCDGCSGVRVTCAGVKQCSGALCWGKPTEKKFAWLLTCLVTVFIFSMIGTVIFCFTDVFNNTILSNLAIRNNTMTYDMWKKPPVNPLTKVFVFNYTNIDEFIKGDDKKLKVKEIGPYVYSEVMERINIKFNGDGTVSYREKRDYSFRPELSSGKQFDKVMVPNLPYLSAVAMAKNSYYVTRMALNALLKSLDSRPFVFLPIHRYIWGYEDPLVNLAKPILAFNGEAPPSIGVLAARNGTQTDLNTIETGEDDITKLGLIRKVNKLIKMTHWGTDECNTIEATDGTMFPPNLVVAKKIVNIFNKDLCRRLPFEYKRDIMVWDDISAYRYGNPENVFDHPSTNPDNQCYCHMDSAICPPRGVFNASPCAYGAPVFASFPHFYLGDEALINSIEGLKPDKKIHDSYIDIHPKLGFPLGGLSRMQFNMQVQKANGITDFLPGGQILPVIWFEIGLDHLPTSVRSLVYHGTYSAAAAQLVLSWGCAVLFLISGLALAFVVRSRAVRRRRHNCSMLKKEQLGGIVKTGNGKQVN